MIYPIVLFGHPVLKKEAEEIDANYPELKKLIDDMFETMYNAHGVGLAAPQIGKGIRMFVVDASPFAEDIEDPKEKELLERFKKVFINPIIVQEEGEEWGFEEGCLSIPEVREIVKRKPKITIEYQDENFNLIEETYEGLAARVIQHEYDHIEGVLFVDKINPLRKRLIKKKLGEISKGNCRASYNTKIYR
ncbi:MAG: peptide deformylase [Luteibaculaceae bacterium]